MPPLYATTSHPRTSALFLSRKSPPRTWIVARPPPVLIIASLLLDWKSPSVRMKSMSPVAVLKFSVRLFPAWRLLNRYVPGPKLAVQELPYVSVPYVPGTIVTVLLLP